jgi:hypothetical protein
VVKRVGDLVTLRRAFWDGPEPRPGDELRTSTGRRYLIRQIRGRALDCVVVPLDAELAGQVFWWRWSPRRPRERASGAGE